MIAVIWAVFTIPVILTGMILHFKLKEWGKKEWNILPKCLSTWAVVCTGMLGIWHTGDAKGMGKLWIAAALVLFFLADGFLELKFFWGMAVFAAGHLALLYWFFSKGAFCMPGVVLWFILLCGCVFLFRSELRQGKENPALYAMILYPAVLMAMTSAAVLLPWQLGKEYLWAAVGAVLFSISDMMVGKSFFQKLSKPVDYLALSLYYGGISCFAAVTWL